MCRELRSGREARVDDRGPVDAEGDGPANGLVVERCESIVEPDVGRVQPLPRRDGQVGVRLGGFDVSRSQLIDRVDRPLAQLREPLARVLLANEDDRRGQRRRAPVPVVTTERDVARAVPGIEAVWACAVDLGQDRLLLLSGVDMALEPGGVVDGQRG